MFFQDKGLLHVVGGVKGALTRHSHSAALAEGAVPIARTPCYHTADDIRRKRNQCTAKTHAWPSRCAQC